MKFTREQFDEIAPFHMDDLPFDTSDQNKMFEIFNLLPDEIKGQAVSWGLNDTVVRESIFEFVCENLGFSSVDQYYNSDVFLDYHEKGKTLSLDELINLLQDQ